MATQKNRPKPGSKADVVLSTIERLDERGVSPVTRNQIYAECTQDDIDVSDVNAMCIYLVKQGFIREKTTTLRHASMGPRTVKAFELVAEVEPA